MKKFMKKFEIKKNYDKKIKEYLSHNDLIVKRVNQQYQMQNMII